MKLRVVGVATLAAGLLPLVSVGAAGSAGWRGDGTGRCPAAAPPLAWGPAQAVVWKTPLPAPSNASPVLSGERLFVCAEPATLLCLSASDGHILWQQGNAYADILPPAEAVKAQAAGTRGAEIAARQKAAEKQIRELTKAVKKEAAPAPDETPRLEALKAEAETCRKELATLGEYVLPPTHDTNGYASCTPVTDGTRVFVLFGNGVAAAYDFEGRRLWARIVEKPTHTWGHSASPVLAGGRLIVHVQNLVALDPATGAEAWRFAAPPRWGTPAVARIGDTEVVVSTSGDVLRAADGVALLKGVCALEYNTPIVQDGVVYFIQHGGKALKLPAATAAPAPQAEILWATTPEKDRYYASPLWHDGLIYDLTRNGVFSVIDAATGVVVHSRKLALGGTAYPSPALAGGHLFVSSDTGVTLILEPGREAKEVGRNTLEPFRTTPAFAGKRIYVRTLKAMYCLGE